MGVAGSLFFAGGVYTGYYFVLNSYKKLPKGDLILIIIGIPALLLMVKPLVEHIHHAKKINISIFPAVLTEWAMEIQEALIGFFGNTVSFSRLAGIGIAHVFLMSSIFDLAKSVNTGNPGSVNSIWSILILIVGNIIVILFEGFSAGVQSLRLTYYEFFSKFFRSTRGEVYHPISLDLSDLNK